MSPARAACTMIVALAALFLIGCGGSDGPPGAEVKTAHLDQITPGGAPVIRMAWARDTFPDPASIVAWLVYRGEHGGVSAEAQNLIDVIDSGGALAYEDTAAGSVPVTFNRTFTYLRRGEQQTGSVDITYDRPALVAGRSYFYRARRVVEPNSSSPPLASSAQATDFNVDPSDAIGNASASQGPVTYFLPPDPTRPTNGSWAIDPRYIVFEWSLAAGADEYQIRIYKSAEAKGQPVVQSPVVRPFGASGKYTYDIGDSAPALKGLTTYYWVVGARRMGEATPTCADESGWLKSAVRQFRTVSLPPPIP